MANAVGAAPAASSTNDTESTESKRPYARNPDRITINAEALARVNAWAAELEARRVTVSRNQLVNWLLCHREPGLSSSELRALEAAFFDEVRFAEWAVRELKAAQARGEAVSLADILARHRPATRSEKLDGQTKAKRSRMRSETARPDATSNPEKTSSDTSAFAQESRIFLDKTGVK